ncbi:MAG: sulfotransferase [Thermoanaerobaculia bacterium]|nr:sulfotransferase [Thermoanaerobaculia bacterium]
MEKQMIDDAIFITGMQRSGTTLLERLLASQSGVSLLSQPFPLLFVEAKRAFLRFIGGGDDLFPLGHLLLEGRYSRRSFATWLREWRISSDDLDDLFARMQSYSGQYTRFEPETVACASATIEADDDFAEVLHKLVRGLARPAGARWVGSKETVCEEYLPLLLERGFRCAIIIRDPRDVVASLNHGRGQEFGGALKPTLFNVRNWRKSVAFALAMEKHPRFFWCRYEDLVTNPARELSRLGNSLAIGDFDAGALDGDIRDSRGVIWPGNSSHLEVVRGVSSSSVGAFRNVLPPEVATLVEAACLPELRLLGYETTLSVADSIRAISGYSEPYEITRPGMERDTATPENLGVEIERLDRLNAAGSEEWFLFESVREQLTEGMR